MAEVRLKIRNFGPISRGYRNDDGFLSFPRVTLFCGEQGAGKSTVAKVLSALSWYEKDLFRSKASMGHAVYGLSTLRAIFAEQSLDEYFRPDTEIEYFGTAVHFRIAGETIKAEWTANSERYLKPQIMYMPAERNLAAIIDRAGALQLLPRPLRDMLVDFRKAKDGLGGAYRLPANGYEFHYDKGADKSWIVNASAAGSPCVSLGAASSGLQSMLPLLLVSDFLWQNIRDSADSSGAIGPEAGQSPEDAYAFGEKLKALASNDMDDASRLEALKRYLSPNRRFINIVEEPELNLYPKTQYKVMTRLLKIANGHPENRLVVCTHSPFVVNHMVLKAFEASLIARMREQSRMDLRDRLPPDDEVLSSDEMRLYQVSGGGIVQVEQSSGVFSDANMLNAELEDWNACFDGLLDLKDELHG